MKRLFSMCALFVFGIIHTGNAQTFEESPKQIAQREIDNYGSTYALLVIERNELPKIRHTINYFLQHARTSIAEEKFEEAAFELESAAAYMRLNAGRGNNDARKRVLDVADEIDDLVSKMVNGSKTTLNVIDATIFSAHRSLARYHQRRAATLLEATFFSHAGYALEAAVVHLQSAALSKARVDKGSVDPELLKKIESWSRLAARLKLNEGVFGADAAQKITNMGHAITALNEKKTSL